MDLSKLPKLSEMPQQANSRTPADHDAGAPRYMPAAEPDAVRSGVGAEVWLSLIIGLLVIAMNFRFAQYVIARLAGGEFDTQTTWTSGELAGQTVNYWDLVNFTALTECAMFIFGLALIFEAILLLVIHSCARGKVPVIALALLITVAATALNLYVSARLIGIGILPLMSGLAVAFGGYMAAYEWRLLNAYRAPSARGSTRL